MPNKLQCEQPIESKVEHNESEVLTAVIRRQVLHALGKPLNLRKVQVCKVWNDHYRVNIVVGENAGSVRLAHSYFLVVDGDGQLVGSTPKITKMY